MSTLLNILMQLQSEVDAGNPPKEFGICNYVWTGSNALTEYDQLRKLYVRWPHYSGDFCFPIPEHKHMTVSDAHDYAQQAYQDRRNDPELMWLEGEYAELRRELLAWLIATLKKEQA